MVLFYSLASVFGQIAKKNYIGGQAAQGVTPITRTSFSQSVSTSENVEAKAATIPLPHPVNANEFGNTEGELSVSLSGGASYEVPIAVPPGISGVVPTIQLTYNSQGGNGLAGYGWNIMGVSVITRIPSTSIHNNAIEAVNFTPTDRFALDGQRLLLKSGEYGKNGAEYQTESFSNVKISSHGVSPYGANYGPAYFMVTYPDGATAQYGVGTSLSRTDYAINYWQNPKGVRISYVYTTADNVMSIASISYGGINAEKGINEIRFIYKARQRPEQSFIGGISFSRNTILNSIQVISNGVGYRNYNLQHDVTSIGYERVISIQERSGDNSQSNNPIVFTYENSPNSSLKIEMTSSLSIKNINNTNAGTVSGDFRGDGKMGFILYPTTGPEAKSTYWLFDDIQNGSEYNIGWTHNVGKFKEILPISWINHTNKLMPMQAWAVVQEIGGSSSSKVDFSVYSAGISAPIYFQYKKEYDFPKFTYTSDDPLGCRSTRPLPPVKGEKTKPRHYFNGDFDGDGLTDILVLEENTFYMSYTCSHPNPGDPISLPTIDEYETRIAYGDAYLVNLDRQQTNFVSKIGYSLNITGKERIMIADVNGDGRADVLIFEKGYLKVYSLSTENRLQLLWEVRDASIVIDKPILLGDYNGDGKTDFIIPEVKDKDSWFFYFSTGTSFVKKQGSIGVQYFENIYGRMGDVTEAFYVPNDLNGDGKTDILYQYLYTSRADQPARRGVRLLENKIVNPSSITFIERAKSVEDTNINRFPVSIFLNSDKPNNNLEYALISNNKIYHYENKKDSREDVLLKEVTNGSQVTKSITYTSLVEDPYDFYYTRSYESTYPNADIEAAPSFKLVKKIEERGGQVARQQDFKYYGAVSNYKGLGFLGFRALLRTDWYGSSGGGKVYTVSKHDPNLRGAVIESYTTLDNNRYFWETTPTSFISKSLYTYKTELLPNKVYKMSNTLLQKLNGLDNTSSLTTNEYDTYNNLLKTTTVLKEGNLAKQTSITQFTYANQSTGAPYYVGRPLNKKQSITAGGETMTNEEQYAYTAQGQLSQLKRKGHQTDFITEDNAYDRFGNTIKTTVTTTGLSPRVTQYEYDISGRYLVKRKDVEGLEYKFEYQTNTGLLTKETNPHGLSTQYLYDIWGKKIKTSDYLGKNISTTYVKGMMSGESIISEKGEDGSENNVFYDFLGRKIKSGVKNAEGKWIYKNYEYDAQDRIIRESEPYFGTSPSLWNTSKYDVYNRPTDLTAATGRITKITYAALKTTVNDGVKTSTTTKDVIGNIVSVTDPGGTIYYTYYANGGPKTTVYGQTTLKVEQDGWGRKTKLIDPSAGIYTYEYNGFGELTKETTPKGVTTFTLDAVGKLLTKTIKGDLTDMRMTYTYDPTSKLLIKLESLSSGELTKYSYTYDTYKRIIETVEETPFAYFQRKNTYDALGRIEKEYNYAKNLRNAKTVSKWIKNTYRNGYHWQIIDDETAKVLWQTDVTNVRGQQERTTLGNGVTTTNTYDAYGFVTNMKHHKGTASIMELTNVFNPLKGTLTSRNNSLYNRKENFQYDNLNRLTHYTNLQGVQEQQTYDLQGRIKSSGIGSYDYTNATQAYQNTGIKLTTEANNYYSKLRKQDVSYNAFKSPVEITETGVDRLSFKYNAFGQRSSMFYGGLQENSLARSQRKHYSYDGAIEIKDNTSTGATEFVIYIGGDGYTAPLALKNNGTKSEYLYLHRDYLGSIMAITNEVGTVVEKRHFDAWGNSIGKLVVLDRGYTGHEHLQSVGLIHMNARLYDAKLHRFLQPDNFVQDPSDTQNFNRYGYVLNNPLMYTDASGEWFFTAVIVGIIIGAASGAAGYIANAIKMGNWNWGQFGVSVIGGAIIGGVSGGIAGTVTTITINAIIQNAAAAFVTGFLPAYNLSIGDWSLNISPSVAFGTGGAPVGVGGGVGYNDGKKWSFSVYGTARIRGSSVGGGFTYSSNGKGYSLGFTSFGGNKAQNNWMVGYKNGDFSFKMTNDAFLRSDKFRTAAAEIGYKEYSVGFNLYTTAPPKEERENKEYGGKSYGTDTDYKSMWGDNPHNTYSEGERVYAGVYVG